MRSLKLKNAFTLYILLHGFTLLFLIGDHYSFPDGLSYILRKTLPHLLLLSLFYLEELRVILKAPNIREMAEYVFKLTWILTGVLIIYMIQLFFRGEYELEFIIGFNWTSYAVITWIFALIIFYISWRRHESRLKSSILTWLTGNLAGFIYEIPIYNSMNPHVGIFYHKTHPFFIAFDWILLPFMIIYLRRNYRLKMSRGLILAILVYIGFSAWYSFNKYTLIPPIHRLPAILLLSMIIHQLSRRV